MQVNIDAWRMYIGACIYRYHQGKKHAPMYMRERGFYASRWWRLWEKWEKCAQLVCEPCA